MDLFVYYAPMTVTLFFALRSYFLNTMYDVPDLE